MRNLQYAAFAGFTAFLGSYFISSEISTSVIIAVIAFLAIPSISEYVIYRKTKEIESRLPDFLLDVVGAINSGMPFTIALKTVSTHNYGKLSPYVKRMAAQIDWGVTFQKILEDFSAEIKSKTVSIAMNTIIEANRSGGNITEVLKATVSSVSEIDKLKKERSSRVYSQLVNGYVIFFVFLGVMITLQGNVFPTLSVSGAGDTEFYNTSFRNLILIQGLFSGLAIGKMSEGTLSAGFKHSAILVTVGLIAFTLFA